jgi:hypothetical protein
MRTGLAGRAGLVAGLLVWQFATSSTARGQPRTADCHSDEDCKVVVSVPVADCNRVYCKASANPEKLHLHGHNASWDLDEDAKSRGFTFEQGYGVWFRPFSGQDELHCKPNGPHGFKCQNQNKAPAGTEYKYGIQLIGPKPVVFLDPWVVNR